MRLKLMPNRNVLTKFAALFFAAIYVQVNVIWAGVPSLTFTASPIRLSPFISSAFSSPSLSRQIVRLFVSGWDKNHSLKNEIFIFHAPYHPDEFVPPRRYEDSARGLEKEKAVKERTLQPLQRVINISDLPEGPVKTALKEKFGDRPIEGVTLRQFIDNGNFTLTKEQKTELMNMFGGGKVALSLFKDTSTGEIIVNIKNANFGATVTINQIDRTATIQSTPLNAGAKSEAKDMKVSLTKETNPAGTKADTAKTIRDERAGDGKILEMGGQQVRLKFDEKTKMLVPVDVKTGKQITEQVFTAQTKDVNGRAVDVKYSIHHFEVQNDQLVAKGAMRVEEGQQFKDGQVGEKGSGEAAREVGNPESHGLDVTVVERSGQILFEGKKGGGDVVYSAAVNENGQVALNQAQFTPITAGAYDITVKTDVGTVIAEAGSQRTWDAGNGNVFRHSDWKVNSSVASTPGGKAVLSHFNISADSSALVNKQGLTVGRVTLGEKREVTQIIGSSIDQGKIAMNQIFFTHKADFKTGGKFEKVEVGMTGPQGKAVVFLNTKATLEATVRTLGRMEAMTVIKDVPRSLIDTYFMKVVGADAGVAKYDVSAQLQLGDKTYDIRIIGQGQDKDWGVALPNIISSSPELTDYLKVERPVEHLAVIGLNLDAKALPNSVTYTIDPITNQIKFDSDGIIMFKNEKTGLTGGVEIKDGKMTRLVLQANQGVDAKAQFGKSESGEAHHTITIPEGQSVMIDTQNGQIRGSLEGVTVEIPSKELTVRFQKDASQPSVVAPVIEGSFKAFDQPVSQNDVKNISFEDGKITINMNEGAAVKMNQSISLLGPDNKNKNAEVDNAQLVQLGLDIVSGSFSGVGRSQLKQDTFIPNGPAGAGVAGAETPLGADSQNFLVKFVEGGAWVRPLNGDSYINMVVRESVVPNTPHLGQAQIITSRAQNIQTAGGDGVLMGRKFDAGWRINKTNDGDFTLEALKAGTGFADQSGRFQTIAQQPGAVLTFQGNQLQNTADLKNITMKLGNAVVSFEAHPDNANKVVPILQNNSDASFVFKGNEIGIADLKPEMKNEDNKDISTGRVIGQMEGGRILFDLKGTQAIYGSVELKIQDNTGALVDVTGSGLRIGQIGFDAATGQSAAGGSFSLQEGKSFVMSVPAADANKNQDNLPKSATAKEVGSKDLELEDVKGDSGQITGMKVTALIDGSKVNATFVQTDPAGNSLVAQPNPVSDYAENLKVGAAGLTAPILGKQFSEGWDIDTKEVAKGDYTLTANAGAKYTQMDNGFVMEAKTDGVLSFAGNQLVTKSVQKESEATTLTPYRSEGSLRQKGTFVYSGQSQELKQEGLTKYGNGQTVVKIKDGEVSIDSQKGPGTLYRNTSGETVNLEIGGRSVAIAPETQFVYTGLEALALDKTFSATSGSLRMDIYTQKEKDGSREIKGVVEFDKDGVAALTEITHFVDGQRHDSPNVYVQEIRQTRDNGDSVRIASTEQGFQIIAASGAEYKNFVFKDVKYDVMGERNQAVPVSDSLGGMSGDKNVSLLTDSAEVLTGELSQKMVDENGASIYDQKIYQLDTGRQIYIAQQTEGEGYIERTGVEFQAADPYNAKQREGIKNGSLVAMKTTVVDDDGDGHEMRMDIQTGKLQFSRDAEFDFQGNQVVVSQRGNDVETIPNQANVTEKNQGREKPFEFTAFTNSGLVTAPYENISAEGGVYTERTSSYEDQKGQTHTFFSGSETTIVHVDGLVMNVGRDGNKSYVVTDHKRVEGNKFAIGSGNRFTMKGDRAHFSPGSYLLLTEAGDRVVIGQGNGKGGGYKTSHLESPGGSGGLMKIDQFGEIEIEKNSIIQETVFLTKGRVEIGENEAGGNTLFMKQGTWLENKSKDKSPVNETFVVGGEGALVRAVNLGNRNTSDRKGLDDAIQSAMSGLIVKKSSYEDDARQMEDGRGLNFIIFANGEQVGNYSIGEAKPLEDTRRTWWTLGFKYADSDTEGNLVGGVFTLNDAMKTVSEEKSKEGDRRYENGSRIVFRTNKDGDREEVVQQIDRSTTNIRSDKEETSVTTTLTIEKDKNGKDILVDQDTSIRVKGGFETTEASYATLGLEGLKMVSESTIYDDDVRDKAKAEITATVEKLREYMKTGALDGLTGEKAVKYITDGERIGDVARAYMPDKAARYGAFSQTSYLWNSQEKADQVVIANAFADSVAGKALTKKEILPLFNEANETQNNFSGFGKFVRWVDTAPHSLVRWAVDHPVETAVFVGSMVAFAGLTALSGGMSLGATPWIFGTFGTTSVWGGTLMAAAASFNFASIAHHAVEGDFGGWFVADLVFAALPGGSVLINYARGGRVLATAAKEAGMAVGSMHEANTLWSAMRTLGYARADGIGMGLITKEAAAMRSVFGDAVALGIKDTKSFVAAASDLKGIARASIKSGSPEFAGVSRILPYSDKGRVAMQGLWKDAVAAGAKIGLKDGAARIGNLSHFISAANKAGFSNFKSVAKTGLDGLSKVSNGKAFAEAWNTVQAKVLFDTVKAGGDVGGAAVKTGAGNIPDVSAARNVTEAVTLHSAKTDGAALVAAIASDANLKTATEKIFVLGRVLNVQGKDAGVFFELGGKLMKELGSDSGAKILTAFFKKGSENAAGFVFNMIKESSTGATVGGVLSTLKDVGAKSFVRAIQGAGGSKLGELFIQKGGAEVGGKFALLFNEGGEGAVKFFAVANEKTIAAIGSKIQQIGSEGVIGQLGKELAKSEGAMGEGFAKIFNQLGTETQPFLDNLSEGGVKQLSELIGTDNAKLSNIISASGFTSGTATTLARVLNEGGEAALAYIRGGEVKGIVQLLSKDSSAVESIFKGLSAGGAEAGMRLTMVVKIENNVITSFDQLVGEVVGAMKSLKGEVADVGEIISAFGRSVGNSSDEIFSKVIRNIDTPSGQKDFIKLFSSGGKEGATNVASFLSGADLTVAGAEAFFALPGKLSAAELKGFLTVALSGDGAASMKAVLSILGAAKGNALPAFVTFIKRGGEASAVILSGLSKASAEHFATGVVNLSKSVSNTDSLWKKVFTEALSKAGSSGAKPFGEAAGKVFNASGSRLTVMIERLGTKGSSGSLQKALAEVAASGGKETGKLSALLQTGGKVIAKAAEKVSAGLASALALPSAAAASTTWKGLSQSAKGSFERLFAGVSSEVGRKTLLETLEGGNAPVLEKFFSALSDDGAAKIVSILNDGQAGKQFSLILRGANLQGGERLAGLVNVIKAEQGAAFFKNLLNVGGAARSFNLLSENAMSRLLQIAPQLTDESAIALGTLFNSASAEVLSAFIEGAANIKNFVSVLNEIGDKAATLFPALFGSLDKNGAQILADIFSQTSVGVLTSFFKALETTGAKAFGQLLSGNLTEPARLGILSLFKNVTAEGAGLFANVLNNVSNVQGLRALFDVLGQKGGEVFGKLLNEIAGTKMGENLVSIISVLNEQGGRALGTIMMKGEQALANLKVVLGSIKSETAKEFGQVLNGLKSEGAALLANAFADAGFSAKNFAQFLSEVGTGKAEVISSFINSLAKEGKQQLFVQLFNESNPIGNLASLIKAITPSGGEQLGVLLSQFKNSADAVKFVGSLTSKQLAGVAAFVNAAKGDVARNFVKIFESSVQAQAGLFHVLEQGKAAATGLANVLEAGGEKSVSTLARLFSEKAASEALGGALTMLGEGGEQGAKLLGDMLANAGGVQLEALISLFNAHGQLKGGGEILGRLLQFMGEKGVKSNGLLRALANLRTMSAGERTGLLIRASLVKNGELAAEAFELSSAVKNIIGVSKTEFSFSRQGFKNFFGGLFKPSADAQFVGDAVKGLFASRTAVGAKAFVKAEEVQAMKDVLNTLLAGKSGLSRAQRNAIRNAIADLGGADDLLSLPIMKLEGATGAVFKGAGNGLTEFALSRVENVVLLARNPDIFLKTSYMSAIGWSGFGFTGVGTLIPIGYDPDFINERGVLVEGKGWYLLEFKWFDPIAKEANGSRKEIGFLRALAITFGEWDGEYMKWRLESARTMFDEGKRFGPLLHVFALQPGGLIGRMAERGVGGNLAYGVVKGLNNFGGPTGWRSVLSAVTTRALPYVDSNLMGTYTRLVGRVFGDKAAQSVATRIVGTFVLGAESVLPFHIISTMGTGLGAEAAKIFYAGESEEVRMRAGIAWGTTAGTVAMFFVPMGKFSNQVVREVLRDGVSSKPGSFAFERARTAAADILAAPIGENAKGSVEIRIGLDVVRVSAHETRQLIREAAHVARASVGQSYEKLNQQRLDTFNEVLSVLSDTSQGSQTRRAEMRQKLATEGKNDSFLGQLNEALKLEGTEQAQKLDQIKASIGAGRSNLSLGELHEALLLKGEAREKKIAQLRRENPELLDLNLENPAFSQAVAEHLLREAGATDQQLAEAGVDGQLAPRSERAVREKNQESLLSKSPEQLREEITVKQKNSVDGMDSGQARTRLANELGSERIAQELEARGKDSEMGPLKESEIREQAQKDVSGMSDSAVKAELKARIETSSRELKPEEITEKFQKNEVDSASKSAKADYYFGGEKVAGTTEGAVKVTAGLREAAVSRHEARILASFGENESLLEGLAKAEVGTSWLSGANRLLGLFDRSFPFTVTNRIKNLAAAKVEAIRIRTETAEMKAAVKAQAGSIKSEILGNKKAVEDFIALGVNRESITLADALDQGLVLDTKSSTLWKKAGGIGTLKLSEFREIAERIESNPAMSFDMSYVLQFAKKIDLHAKALNPKEGKFEWKESQLYSTILSAEGNINMAAGGGKTPIMVTRALMEAFNTTTPQGKNESAVFLISENPSSVDNILGTGSVFDLAVLGKNAGIEVIDLRLELAYARDGKKNGKAYSIEDVNKLLEQGTGLEGQRVRRIVVVDFDTLGGALSEFKANGFLRAYTSTQIRLFDEVHRVTTDPVTYVIGEQGGIRAAEYKAFNFRGLKALEEATVSKSGEKGKVGIEKTADGREFLRIRGVDGTIRVFRSESEWRRFGESQAAVFLDGATGKANRNTKAGEMIQKGAGSSLNTPEITSFLRGRLTEIHSLDADIKYVNNALVDGKREGQYRPVQRGLGVKENQVIEDVAYLIGMNARRAELHRGGRHEITYSENSGAFQVLETVRGISRYEFFEATGDAVQFNKLRGFTATAAGYEGFIRLATGAPVIDTLVNTVADSIIGLSDVRVNETRNGFYAEVENRVIDIAKNGADVYRTTVKNPRNASKNQTVEGQRRILVGTEDATQSAKLKERIIQEGLVDRLYSKEWVWDTVMGEAVEAKKAGLIVKQQGNEFFVVRAKEGQLATRYEAIERVINNETAENKIQAIVKSFKEKDAIVISNQRGLTGKDFQERGTVILADTKLTVGELIQNLERLGRTVKDGTGRWDVRRELYLNKEDLAIQMDGAYGKRTAFESLLADRVSAGLTTVKTAEALKTFFRQVEAKASAMETGKAVREVISEWTSRNDPESSKESLQGLIRVNVELNLLERNTGVAKTVANEVFFHHDVGRTLNEAFHESRGNARDQEILSKFEKEFRNERQRSQDQSFEGSETAEGKVQLERISDNSRSSAIGLLTKLLTGDGMKLSRPVRSILEKQLDYLRQTIDIKFDDATSLVIIEKDSFARAGRADSVQQRFIESRSLVFDRLKNDIAPSTDGGVKNPRQSVEIARALNKLGVSGDGMAPLLKTLSGRDFSYVDSAGVRWLTRRGDAYASAILQTMGLNKDEDRASFTAVLNAVENLGTSLSLTNLTSANEDQRVDTAIKFVETIVESRILDLGKATGNEISDLLRAGDVLRAYPDLLQKPMDVSTLRNIIQAEVSGYTMLREGLEKGAKEGNKKNQQQLMTLEAAQRRAPMAEMLNQLLGQAGSLPSTPQIEKLKQQSQMLNREQAAARAVVDTTILPSSFMRTVSNYLKGPATLLSSFIGKIWSGDWKAKTLKVGAVLGGLGLGASVAVGLGLATWAGLGIGLVGLAGGFAAVVLGGKQFSAEFKLARSQKTIQKAQDVLVEPFVSEGRDNKQVLSDIAILHGGTVQGRSKVISALGILKDLGSQAAVSRSRLKISDLITISGQDALKVNPILGQTELVKGASDFRKAFREWLNEAAKTKLDIPKALRKAVETVPALLQMSASLSIFGLISPMASIVMVSSGMFIRKLLGKEDPLMKLVSKTKGLFGNSKPAESFEIQPLKQGKLGGFFLGWLGRLIGARGDKDLFKTLVKLNAWDVEKSQRAKAKADQQEKMSEQEKMAEMFKKMQGGGQEEEKEDPVDTFARLEKDFEKEADQDAALLALGFTKEDAGRMEKQQLEKVHKKKGYLNKISLSELADPSFNLSVKTSELDYNEIQAALSSERKGQPSVEPLSVEVYEKISEQNLVPIWKIRAADEVLLQSHGNAPTVQDVTQVVALHQADDAGRVEEFLYNSLGVNLQTAKENIADITALVRSKLGVASGSLDTMMWTLPRTLKVSDLKNFRVTEGTVSRSSSFDTVGLIAQMGVGLLKGTLQIPLPTEQPNEAYARFFHGTKEVAGFYTQFAAFVGKSSDGERAQILSILKQSFNDKGHQLPWLLIGTVDSLKTDIQRLHASAVLIDLAGALTQAGRRQELTPAVRAIEKSVDYAALGSVLNAAGVASGLSLKDSLQHYLVGPVMRQLVQDLELVISGPQGPQGPPSGGVSPDQPDLGTSATLAPWNSTVLSPRIQKVDASNPDAVPALPKESDGKPLGLRKAVSEVSKEIKAAQRPKFTTQEQESLNQKLETFFADVNAFDQTKPNLVPLNDPLAMRVWSAAIGFMKEPAFGGLLFDARLNAVTQENANFGVTTDRKMILVRSPSGVWTGYYRQVSGNTQQLQFYPTIKMEIIANRANFFQLPVPGAQTSAPVAGSSAQSQTQPAQSTPDPVQGQTPVSSVAGNPGVASVAKALLLVIGIGLFMASPAQAMTATVGAGTGVSTALQSSVVLPILFTALFVPQVRGFLSDGFNYARTVIQNISDRAQRSEGRAPRAHGPYLASTVVSTEQGDQNVEFRSERSFQQAFLAGKGDTDERVFARTVDQSGDKKVVGEGREFRRITLLGSSDYETGVMKDLAQALSENRLAAPPSFDPLQANDGALRKMQALFSNPILSGGLNQIEVTSLLKGFAAAFPNAAANMEKALGPLSHLTTLGQVATLGNEYNAFKSYVYNLVFFNAEAVSTPAGTMVAAQTVADVSNELGGNIVIHHTQPGQVQASLEDRIAARRLFFLGSRIGHVVDFPLLVSNASSLAFFNDIKDVMLTRSSIKELQSPARPAAPYQSLRVGLVDQVGENTLSTLGRLFDRFLGRDTQPLNPGTQALANAALRLATKLHDLKGLSAGQMRVVWGLVQELAVGSSQPRIDDVLSNAGLKGLGLEELITQLSQQIRQMSPGAMGFVANGHLRDIGPHIHFFLNVSALPANMNDAQFETWMKTSDAKWVAKNLGTAMDSVLMDANGARKLAKSLRSKVASRQGFDDLFGTLRMLAGVYEGEFFDQMKAGFTTQAEVEAALGGKSKNRVAQATALQLLLKPLAQSLLQANRFSTNENVDRLISRMEVSIVNPEYIPNGKARTFERADGRIEIQIALESGLTAQEAFVQAVGRTAHEISDLLANAALKKYSLGDLGAPTILTEAWSARATSQALRWLKLDIIADIVDLQTAENVVTMDQSQGFYVTYQNIRGNAKLIGALISRVQADKGTTRVVVLANSRDYAAALSELGTKGLVVASSEQILGLTSANGETALETHGRLYLGTRAVKLLADQTVFDSDAQLKAVVTLAGRVVPELVTLLSPIDYTSRIESIIQERITARIISRQA